MKNHRRKQRWHITLSNELSARLQRFKREHGLKTESQVLEFICWQYLNDKTLLSLNQLEAAEIELAKCETKVRQFKRRKEFAKELQNANNY